MKIVIDMMGGDNGIEVTIGAVNEFYKRHSEVELFLVGDENILNIEFKDIYNIHVVPSQTVLAMDVDPMTALKEKTSSLMVAVDTFIANSCDALISAGSTGATLSAAVFKIKRLKGISRPGLITPFPSMIKGKKYVVCDLGANNANTKEDLLNFALMASTYYQVRYNEPSPRVHLLSNGTEEEKGSPLGKEVYPLLKDCPDINFQGNIEARDPLFGVTDVVVCDGYSGNIYLKATEGGCKVMSELIKKSFKKNIFTKLGYLFAKKGFDDLRETMDYQSVGGAMLVGVNGIVVKAHGNSNIKSFLSALEGAYDLAYGEVLKKIKEKLEQYGNW